MTRPQTPLAALAALALAVSLAACGQGSQNTSSPAAATPGTSGTPTTTTTTSSPDATPATTPGASPTASPSPTGTAAASPAAGEFVNPVIAANFPDPDVLQFEGTFYAYATTRGAPDTDEFRNFQGARSEDLVNWEMLPDVMPKLASWSGFTPLFAADPHPATWAPDVERIGDRFLMYYTAPALAMERPDGRPSQCVGVAVSAKPEGPFVDTRKEPLVCQAGLGGSIDAGYFQDTDKKHYLVWKNDGNCCGEPTNFFLQGLNGDGTELVGTATRLEGLENDEPWEGDVIEAPTLVVQGDTYYMFFSGNNFASHEYAVGYATAKKLTGPYTDAPENPILATDLATIEEKNLAGPGHQTVFADDDGDLWMAYHAWDRSGIGNDEIGRRLWLDELVFENGKPIVKGPDIGPQPVP